MADTKNQYINLYMNNPTSGGTDGDAISSGDSEANCLSVTLDAANSETSNAIPVAIRCEAGYKTTGNTVISFVGSNASKWSISDSASGVFSSSLTLTDEIGTTNRLFYVKATSSSDEEPANDTSTNIRVATKIAVAA